MKIGFQIPFSGNLKKLESEIRISRGNSFQIFSRGMRALNREGEIVELKKIKPSELEKFKEYLTKSKIEEYVVHAPYTYNLSKNDFNIDYVLEDLEFVKKIGAAYYIVHPGYYKGMDKKDAILFFSENIKKIIEKMSWNGMILIKNMAGAGTEWGSRFEEINEVIKNEKQIGLALDLARGYLSGYDFTTYETANIFYQEIERLIGVEKVKVIYANDTEREIGTKKNIFAPLGRGVIGWNGMEFFLGKEKIKEKIIIAENQPDVFSKDISIEYLLMFLNRKV